MIVVQIIYTYKSCVRCKFNLFNLLYGAFRLIKKQKNDSSTISNQTNYLIALRFTTQSVYNYIDEYEYRYLFNIKSFTRYRKDFSFSFFWREREREKQAKDRITNITYFQFRRVSFLLSNERIDNNSKESFERERENEIFIRVSFFTATLFFPLLFFPFYTEIHCNCNSQQYARRNAQFEIVIHHVRACARNFKSERKRERKGEREKKRKK